MPLRVTAIKRRDYRVIRDLLFRTPVQIEKIIRYKSGDSYPICPRCDCSLDREYMRFCDRCGQRLSWGHEKQIQIVYAPRYKILKKNCQNCPEQKEYLHVGARRE